MTSLAINELAAPGEWERAAFRGPACKDEMPVLLCYGERCDEEDAERHGVSQFVPAQFPYG
jgi:hypothetical protein